MMPSRLALSCIATMVTIGVSASVAESSALGKVVQPLTIAGFSLQTTHTVETGTSTAPVFENVPYSFTQASGHPDALTARITLSGEKVEINTKPGGSGEFLEVPTEDPKDMVVDLPPGLLGDPMAVPRCPLTRLLGERQPCPGDTQIGVARVRWFGGVKEVMGPVVNVVPEAGQSAEFAVENSANIPFLETAHLVRTSEGYGFSVVSNDIPTVYPIEIEQTIWGVPADPSHNALRGLECTRVLASSPLCDQPKRVSGESAEVTPVPFLTWLANCSAGPEKATIRGDSWEHPGYVGVNGQYVGYTDGPPSEVPGATGCNVLKFEPTLAIGPDTALADEPVGLAVKLGVPLEEAVNTNATPPLRDSSVTLPQGVSISPGAVDGIQACEATGPNGIDIEGPGSEEVGSNGELQLAPGHCPDASTVGTAEAITPFLPVPVRGHVYLARPGCGGAGQSPCTEADALDGNLYRLYLELGGTGELAKTGIHFKVPGDVEVDPSTGQLTTRFLDTVQAPFSELRVDLTGGPRASLANPAECGPALTTSDFTPWSAPGVTPQGVAMPGTPDATPLSHYEVLGCASPPPLHPTARAGVVTPRAAQFTSFEMEIARADREQYVKAVRVHTPRGLSGMVSSVTLCREPAADEGNCGPESEIGTTRAASGAGSHPFEIEGKVFLTGPYRGAPFGLSIVVPVVAGPFNLGRRVVRARVSVDRNDATLTVTTDESGPYAIPQIVFGVPVRLKRVTVKIDRKGFMFNPTSCAPAQIEIGVAGTQGGVAGVASPLGDSGCRGLAFKPSFSATTSAHTSRARGASLDARLSYPKGSVGTEANIARVRVSLPRALPSRLSTLQKACPARVFETNPANCPAAAIVGVARASTPVLPVRLSGPVYFVSHGGEAFPSLVIVLQGDNVRVDLTGTTFISKAGITSSTFKTLPDVPVSSFELYLPQGRYSALAANRPLCKVRKTLKMPTEFVAQNGAVVRRTTKIGVRGC